MTSTTCHNVSHFPSSMGTAPDPSLGVNVLMTHEHRWDIPPSPPSPQCYSARCHRQVSGWTETWKVINLWSCLLQIPRLVFSSDQMASSCYIFSAGKPARQTNTSLPAQDKSHVPLYRISRKPDVSL